MTPPNEPLVRVKANHVAKPRGFGETMLAWQPFQALTGIYGNVAVGGHLSVTADELVFEPHAVNLHTDVVVIPRSEITGVRSLQRLTSALLRITTRDGRETDFVCWSRPEVVRALGF